MYRNIGLRLTKFITNDISKQKLNFHNALSTNKISLHQNTHLKALKMNNKNNSKQFSIHSSSRLNKDVLKETPSESITQETIPNQDQKDNEDTSKSKGFAKYFQREHAWKITLSVFGLTFAFGAGYAFIEWGQPKRDKDGNEIKDDFSGLPMFEQYWKRVMNSAFDYYQMIRDPTSDKLLPEPLQDPYYQPPYTLIIELNGILLHPEWNYKTGWRYKKRPGADFFIDQLKYPLFEVVLVTNETMMTMAGIVAALDPDNKIQFKLFRDALKFTNGTYVKDLSCFNRDAKKIILIDWDEKAYQLQPRNALHRLKKWEGDDADTDLVYLAQFLKTLATSGVDDTREVLDYYNKETVPLEAIKYNLVKSMEEEEARRKKMLEWKEKKKSSPFSLFKR